MPKRNAVPVVHEGELQLWDMYWDDGRWVGSRRTLRQVAAHFRYLESLDGQRS